MYYVSILCKNKLPYFPIRLNESCVIDVILRFAERTRERDLTRNVCFTIQFRAKKTFPAKYYLKNVRHSKLHKEQETDDNCHRQNTTKKMSSTIFSSQMWQVIISCEVSVDGQYKSFESGHLLLNKIETKHRHFIYDHFFSRRFLCYLLARTW